MSTSDPLSRDLVTILDSSNYLDDHISQVSLEALPSLVYSKNEIKAAQTG